MIKADHLSKIYKVNTEKKQNVLSSIFHPNRSEIYGVKGISFEIQDGEKVGYIGLNGAGKSTTIKLLTGILKPSEGQLSVCGCTPHKERKTLAKKMGVVFGQRNQLWWDLPLMDSFALIKGIYSISDSDYHAKFEELSEVLSLREMMNVPVRQLSLGQRMRGNLMAALLHNPQVLFLDEPTLGLDIDSRRNFIKFIQSLNRQKVTVFLTTHNMRDIEEVCDRIIILDKGRIIYDGRLEDIYSDDYGKYVIRVKIKNPYEDKENKYLIDAEGWIEYQARNNEEKERFINEILQRYTIEDISIYENNLEGYLLNHTGVKK